MLFGSPPVHTAATQRPLKHESPAPHAFPHAPQLALLVCVSTQPAPAQQRLEVPESGLQ